jgi:hypothetical protein
MQYVATHRGTLKSLIAYFWPFIDSAGMIQTSPSIRAAWTTCSTQKGKQRIKIIARYQRPVIAAIRAERSI